MVQGSNPSCKNSEESHCYSRVPTTACQTEERSICSRSARKTGADPVTGPPTAVKIAEAFWPYDSFNFFFFLLIMDKKQSHKSSFRCALKPCCISRSILPSSKLLTLEKFLAPCSTAANTRTAGVLGHSCASPSWNFWILMRKLKTNPLISWSTSGYKHDFAAVWEPNRRDSHLKNNSFSFTLQWTNWNNLQKIQILKGDNLIREILTVRKFSEGQLSWFQLG